MAHHSGSNHVVEEVEDFKKNMKDEIESLKKRGMEKMERIRSYTKIVKEQTAKVESIIADREADINKAFDETLLQLNAKKNTLLSQCKELRKKLTDELINQGKNGKEMISTLSGACKLVGNEGEAVEVHHNLCRELKDMLDRDDPDESKSKQVTRRAEAVTFTPCRLDDEHNLGILNMNDWELEKVAEFKARGRAPWSLSSTKDGKMLAGYYDGGIEEFTVSGSPKIVREDFGVSAISVLSDGRWVVRYHTEKIFLYSAEWNKLATSEFEMRGRCDFGGMDVDKYNNIFVGYRNAKSIRVFTPEGGAPTVKIPCRGYSPWDVCTMNHSNRLVVSNGATVRVIDQQGRVQYEVTAKEDYLAKPTVLHDDSIPIGWWKDGHVTIDLYTKQLRHVGTVINGLECSRPWALREFSSGEIALCTCHKFYVLCKR